MKFDFFEIHFPFFNSNNQHEVMIISCQSGRVLTVHFESHRSLTAPKTKIKNKKSLIVKVNVTRIFFHIAFTLKIHEKIKNQKKFKKSVDI